ncbi:MAG: RNA polymerase sigma factor [Verrucomicrobiales bacterium]|nr:RNA polymerase sigma factor [Verrucomicrobiales bacterium]
MTTNTTSTQGDHEIVHAVRAGELDRFRELIERYEGQVYAVAWSRLGDASLAEEVVQETFIKAYRYLGWLRDPSRFGAWLTRITRGLAINFGIRHRRELHRRQRWALDLSATGTGEAVLEEGPLVSHDALREALAGLSANHRECLVLHYLEGRSIQDAAQALGISAGAFKVRLHRARAALRESIETRLGDSLRQLGPRTSQASAIMAALPGIGSAGAGSGLLAGLGVTKLLPMSWVALLLPLVSMVFGVGAAAWLANAERKNYLEPAGFRARLHYRATLRNLILTAVVLTLVLVGQFWAPGGITSLHVIVVVASILWAVSLRILQINRRPEMIIQTLSTLPLLVVVGVGLFIKIPTWWLFGAQIITFAAVAFSMRSRPLRFDYNLFLRATKGMLPAAPSALPIQRHTPSEIMAFGRLLGSHWLICSYRRNLREVSFGLTPVRSSPWQWAWPILGQRSSVIRIGVDGTVTARPGINDRTAIEELAPEHVESWTQRETSVVLAVRQSLERFFSGDGNGAIAALGGTSESEVFVQPPDRSRAFLVQRAFLIGGALAALLFAILEFRKKPWDVFERSAAALSPTSLTPEVAQRSMARLSVVRNTDSARLWRELSAGLSTSDVLPPGDWFSPDGLSRLRSNLLVSTMRQVDGTEAYVDMALGHCRIQKALVHGWITTNDLLVYGINTATIRRTAASWEKNHRDRRLGLETSSVAQRTNLTVLNVDDLRWRMEMLRVYGCLDLVQRDAVVNTLLAHQVVDGRSRPAGRRTDLDVDAWRGLFATAGWSPIDETSAAVAVLGMLGALDRVDRVACLNGLLRYHYGQGKFGPLDPTKDVFISASPLTTLRVLETFHAFGALHEIADLDQWDFWLPKGLDSTPAEGSSRDLVWGEIEAVLGRQHLALLRQGIVRAAK